MSSHFERKFADCAAAETHDGTAEMTMADSNGLGAHSCIPQNFRRRISWSSELLAVVRKKNSAVPVLVRLMPTRAGSKE